MKTSTHWRWLMMLACLAHPFIPAEAHDHRHHSHVGVGIAIGVPLFSPWVGSPWAPVNAYDPFYRPYVPAAPPVYVEQADPAGSAYWYRCEQPAGYFPYVTQCPGGWLKVLPPPPPR